jgi:cytochrome oxidase Cu insertion factor (SCO1/SenC/PrrC family)
MSELQAALAAQADVRLVTLTTDAEYDRPPVLKAYGSRFGADFRRWMFLTGTPKQIASLATDSLKLTALEKKPEERVSPADLFIHSTILVVIDKHGRLRGIFETTGDNVDPVQTRREIVSAVRRLEHES